MNCSLFLKNAEKNILQFDLQKKNFVKRIANLPQHLSEKFIGDNLSIIDIAIRNRDLSVSPRAFLKLSIIALVQKSLSCPSLTVDRVLKEISLKNMSLRKTLVQLAYTALFLCKNILLGVG